MSLFDACEQFFKQIYPQHYFEDEDDPKIDLKVISEEVDSDDEYSLCPPVIAASELVKWIIYMEKLFKKKET